MLGEVPLSMGHNSSSPGRGEGTGLKADLKESPLQGTPTAAEQAVMDSPAPGCLLHSCGLSGWN